MREPAFSSAERRVPRLSIPGGLLLMLCLFLPAVKGCDKPVYPYTMPMFYGPYVFGLLVATLAFFPTASKMVFARFAAWIIGTVSAAGEGWFFVSGLLNSSASTNFLAFPALLIWLPLFLMMAASLRHRSDPERWRIMLLGSGGGLILVFFLYLALIEKTYYGLWLSIVGTTCLILEALGTTIQWKKIRATDS